MHRHVALILLAIGFTTQIASAELVAFYPFEGDANDVSGNANDGVVSGASLTASGYEGQAYSFDGSNDYISIPVNINPGVLPRVTMGAWVNTDAVNAIRAVISHDDGGFDRNLNIDVRGSGTGYRYAAFTGFGVTAAGPDPAPVGEWVFVAVRYDDLANRMTLDVGADRITVGANPGFGYSTTRIGSNPGFGEYFDGRIDNVFIFDEFLSDRRIDAIRRGGAAAVIPEPASVVLAAAAIAFGLAFAKFRRQ